MPGKPMPGAKRIIAGAMQDYWRSYYAPEGPKRSPPLFQGHAGYAIAVLEAIHAAGYTIVKIEPDEKD